MTAQESRPATPVQEEGGKERADAPRPGTGTGAPVASRQGASPRAEPRPRSAREAYSAVLPELMLADERLYCLDSDTGLFDPDAFAAVPGRYLNLGIAEQSLMGTAAGLAASGKVPFVTTMATFAATRALEAIKIDIVYNALPVRIVATHGGLAAGHLGPTHHALEDLAVMRALPGLTVVVPADADQAEAAVRQSAALPGPVYVRLGRKATPDVGGGAFEIGRAQWLRRGRDVAVIACGPRPVLAALAAADR
ncbi:hypothetical protein DZF91_19605, partial [Actinomadura logoneensis]